MPRIHPLRTLLPLAPLLVSLAACAPDAPTGGATPAAERPAAGSSGAGAATSAGTPGSSSTATAGSAAMPTMAALADRLVAAMGGRTALAGVDTLVARGDGTRTRLGQIAETGGDDPMGTLANVVETIDFANGRAAFDYDVMLEEFMQHRTEVLTTHRGTHVGWETGPGRPNIAVSLNGLFSWATQNSPEWLLRRNVVAIALAAAESSPATPADERSFAGGRSLRGTAELASGETVDLFYDPDTGLLDGFTTLDTETMLGDVRAEYLLADWRPVGGLVLPHSLTIRKQGRPYSSIGYSSITVNAPGARDIFAIPADAIAQADEVVATDGGRAPLAWNEVADGVYHAVGYSHHSMVVELPDFVVVVEGPYTEAQSQTLARTIEREIGKPIAYVVPTHPHYDHTGGIRGLAAAGATVLVADGHAGELRAIVESPHTNPPDELARRERTGEEVGSLETFTGMTTIGEGARRVELFEVDTIPHVKPKVLAYVPDARVIFESDLFFGAPSPDATALYEAIESRGLDVERIVGGHGGVLPFSALAEAAGGN